MQTSDYYLALLGVQLCNKIGKQSQMTQQKKKEKNIFRNREKEFGPEKLEQV